VTTSIFQNQYFQIKKKIPPPSPPKPLFEMAVIPVLSIESFHNSLLKEVVTDRWRVQKHHNTGHLV
jgi:hypothetical protein